MPDPIDDAKRALRADLRERRQLRSEPARAEAAEGLRVQLDELIARLGARSVSCYISTTSEPNTRVFLDHAVTRGLRVLLPVSRDDGLLDWAVAQSGPETVEGLWGLPEPTGELLGPIAVNDVDLMIVPAAAVDRGGMRLGWGRGYFDRTLGSMERRPPVYAVVFDSELLDEVPRDVHDQPVTGIVTPTRTVAFATR
jgi:5-formyltetrahydrofolate cyclo-ligase